MIAQRKYEEVRTVSQRTRRKSRPSLFKDLKRSPMTSVVVLAAVVCLIASIYVDAYARFTEKGHARAELMSTLVKARKVNDQLRLQVEALKQPERIEAFAKASGMTQCQETAYIEPVERPNVARNPEAGDIR